MSVPFSSSDPLGVSKLLGAMSRARLVRTAAMLMTCWPARLPAGSVAAQAESLACPLWLSWPGLERRRGRWHEGAPSTQRSAELLRAHLDARRTVRALVHGDGTTSANAAPRVGDEFLQRIFGSSERLRKTLKVLPCDVAICIVLVGYSPLLCSRELRRTGDVVTQASDV